MPKVPGPRDKRSNIPEDTIQTPDDAAEVTEEAADLVADAGLWDVRWEYNEGISDIDARVKKHGQFLEALHKACRDYLGRDSPKFPDHTM